MMDIQIKDYKHKYMEAFLVNADDDLLITIKEPDNQKFPSASAQFRVSTMPNIMCIGCIKTYFKAIQYGIKHDTPKIYLNGNLHLAHTNGKTAVRLSNLSLANDLDIYSHTLYHSIDMLRSFFTSNEYRNYMANSKYGKLIAKKRYLSREISKIDKKLNN